MNNETFDDELELYDEFDPLGEEDEDIFIDSNETDDEFDGLVDIPVVPNMPEGLVRKGVYDINSYDDPYTALELLFEKNPARRPVYLTIIELCAEGKPASVIAQAVEEAQKDNKSVYAPMTLCRALERAGALTVEIPESAVAKEDGDAEYLEITDHVDPVWTSTEVGLSVLAKQREGHALRELLEFDHVYLEIYQRVLAFINEAPRSKSEINEIVDDDPLVQDPRRYSNHFIEHLERTDALIWKDGKWTITELGKKTLADLQKEAS